MGSESKNLETLNSEIKKLETLIIEQDSITPPGATCLVKPDDRDPLDYYKAILQAYRPFCDQESHKMHVPAYASLARTLFNIIKKRTVYQKCFNLLEAAFSPEEVRRHMERFRNGKEDGWWSRVEIKPIIGLIEDQSERDKKDCEFSTCFELFETEINEKLRAKEANYQWFMLFSDQLSGLTSKLLGYRSFTSVNTGYSAYFEYVDRKENFPNFSEEKYFMTTSIPRIDKVMSLPSLIKQFPVFMMPFPFILGPKDFLNLTVGSNRLFWPCGMVFRPVIADGWHHDPRSFFGHDWHHLGLLLASILSPCIFDKSQESLLANPKILSDVLFISQNSFGLYCRLQNELYKQVSNILDEDTQKIFSFFAFHGVHENVLTFCQRIKNILGKCDVDFSIGPYHNINYYKPLYPSSVSHMDASKLKGYLQNQWTQYREFCSTHLSPELINDSDVFLKHSTESSSIGLYKYPIDMKKYLESTIKSPFNTFFEFTFDKLCTSSSEIPPLSYIRYSSDSCQEDIFPDGIKDYVTKAYKIFWAHMHAVEQTKASPSFDPILVKKRVFCQHALEVFSGKESIKEFSATLPKKWTEEDKQTAWKYYQRQSKKMFQYWPDQEFFARSDMISYWLFYDVPESRQYFAPNGRLAENQITKKDLCQEGATLFEIGTPPGYSLKIYNGLCDSVDCLTELANQPLGKDGYVNSQSWRRYQAKNSRGEMQYFFLFPKTPGKCLDEHWDDFLKGNVELEFMQTLTNRLGATAGKFHYQFAIDPQVPIEEITSYALYIQGEDVFYDPLTGQISLFESSKLGEVFKTREKIVQGWDALLFNCLNLSFLFYQETYKTEKLLIDSFLEGYSKNFKREDFRPYFHGVVSKTLQQIYDLLYENTEKSSDSEAEDGDYIQLTPATKEEASRILEEFKA